MRITIITPPQVEYGEDAWTSDRCTFHFYSDGGRSGMAIISGRFEGECPVPANTGERTEIDGHWSDRRTYHVQQDAGSWTDTEAEMHEPADVLALAHTLQESAEQGQDMITIIIQSAQTMTPQELHDQLHAVSALLGRMFTSSGELHRELTDEEHCYAQDAISQFAAYNKAQEAEEGDLPF